MKILHAYKDFDPPIRGGMERHIALMCRYQREWAEVEVLSCSRNFRTRRVVRNTIDVTEVGEWGRFQSAPLAPTYPIHLRTHAADVRVLHFPNPTAEIGYLLTRPPGALVVRYHSDVVRQAAAMAVYRPLLMKFLAKADIILPTSEQYLNTSKTLEPFRNKCRVVPLGIVAEDFETPRAERVQELREQYGGRYVLFTGRHRYYKGLDYLVKAALEIRARVVIAGEGPETHNLQTLARDLGAEVAFPGELSDDDLVDHLHGCEVFVFPSIERSEAFGVSILEAQACGKPVIATTLGTGVEYANLHETTGLNVPPRDSAGLAQAVNELLKDDERRERLGAQAIERIRRDFSARNVAKAEFDLYQEAIECSKAGT